MTGWGVVVDVVGAVDNETMGVERWSLSRGRFDRIWRM